LKATDLSADRLFIVPGNHDLDRDELKLLSAELLRPLTSEAEIQGCLTNDRKKSKYLDPFWAFARFIKRYTGQNPPDFANTREWQLNGKKITLLGLNSAWMSGRNDNEKGFVIVGEPQLKDSINKTACADLRIAVLNYPLDWLAEFDFNRIERPLRSNFDFILCGHTHKPRVEASKSTVGNAVIIPAGASYRKRIEESPHYTSSYNFVNIDLEDGRVSVFLRRWNDERGEWVEDISSSLGGQFNFELKEIGTRSESCTILLSSGSKSSIVPRQIPRPPADFKSREDEIKDILSNFGQGATINGMRGMPGVGKTALAFVLAERL
jgi:predicted phosphodiesterase